MTTASLFVGAFAPAIVLLAVVAFDNFRRRRVVSPPQEEKLLRPPGYSLALELDSLMDRGTTQLVWAMFWTAWAGILSGYLSRLFTQDVSKGWIALGFAALVTTILAGTALAIRAYRTMQARRKVRLGLRGEQATAEALHEAADAGFRIFHDIQAGDDWNIDHVAVGTKGVYLMETKARARLASKKDQHAHHVKYDGTTLEFPSEIDRNSVAQARRSAGWLSSYLMKKTGESVSVDAIVVLPGWWVDGQSDAVKAMNCKYLIKYLRGQKERIAPEQAARFIDVLDEKNRTLDFI